MATLKSSEKSKTKKTSPGKMTKKPRTSKTKKIIDAQPASTEPSRISITAEFEEKLTRSFYSIEKQLKSILFSGPLISLYLLYMVFKSKGELITILNFLGVVALSAGLGYSSHLFTKQSKKSIMVYGCTMLLALLFSGFVIWLTSSNELILGLIIGLFFALFIFVEMTRLKKYNFLD